MRCSNRRSGSMVPGWVAAMLVIGALVPRPADAAAAWPDGNPPYEVQVVVDGVPLHEYRHKDTTWVEGRQGRRYALRLINHTGRRVEVVASVDGLDVLDGKPGDFTRKRGYVLGPWQTYDVEGFRMDLGRVAAFRFSSVAESYAARTGTARNVGVIGVAFFEERRPPRPRPVRPQARDRYGAWDMSTTDETAESWDAEAPSPSRAEAGRRSLGSGMSQSMGAEREPPASEPSGASLDGMAKGRATATRSRRPGLGTAFGESRESAVSETAFVRANPSTPTRLLSLKYDDRRGLRAQGVIPPRRRPSETWLRATADPFPAAPHPRRFAQPPRGWQE